jgi:hypothetical protein
MEAKAPKVVDDKPVLTSFQRSKSTLARILAITCRALIKSRYQSVLSVGHEARSVDKPGVEPMASHHDGHLTRILAWDGAVWVTRSTDAFGRRSLGRHLIVL